MIRFLTVVTASFALAFSANAQDFDSKKEQEAQTEWSVAWMGGLYSRYFAGSNGFVVADEPVFQSEVDLCGKYRNLSWAFMVWGSKGFQEIWKSFGDEADFGISAAYAGPVDVSVTFWHFVLVPAAGSDVQTVWFKVGKTVALTKSTSITPSVDFDLYWPTGSAGPKRGNYVFGTVFFNQAIASWLGTSQQFKLVKDIDGAFGGKAGTTIFRYDGGLDFNYRGWTFTPKVIYGGSFNDPARPFNVTAALVVGKGFVLGQ